MGLEVGHRVDFLAFRYISRGLWSFFFLKRLILYIKKLKESYNL